MLKSILHKGWVILVVMMMLTTLVVSSTPPKAFSALADQPVVDHVPAWDGNFHAYVVGDLVTYNGAHYRCRQSHTSQPGWDPVTVPALWEPVSPTGPTPTRTNTPIGPTATLTRTSTRTNTPIGPTATRTPTQIAATPTATATSGGTPAWAPGVSYAVGNVVSSNGRLYRCTFSISTSLT